MSASAESGQKSRFKTRTISITSGKGGVGKSTLLSNLAVYFSSMGKRVLILDGDLGMANVDVMFGLRAHSSVDDVLKGDKSIEETMLQLLPGIDLIPGGSGIYGLQNINTFQKKMLLDQIGTMVKQYDVMLVDTASGIDDNVLYLSSAAQEILVVVTPEPASLTDAYALIKVLNKKYDEQKFSIVCNMVQDEQEALMVFKRLSDVANRFLCVSLDYKGFVPSDNNLRTATKSQQLVVQSSPRSPSSYAIQMLGQKLSHSASLAGVKGGMQFFWEQLVGVA